MPRSSTRFPAGTLLTLLVLAAFFFDAPVPALMAGELPSPADNVQPVRRLPNQHNAFVIVTTEALAGEFTRLAEHRVAGGLTARVATLEWIYAQGMPGDDPPAVIRNFLRIAYFEWQTRHVLLGGDAELLPPRLARTYLWPPNEYTDFPSDLYFACLDGDWDADGDGIFGEAAHDGEPGDEPDLVPELTIGRAPVRDAAEAAEFVDKILAYEQRRSSSAQYRALLMGDVLFPADWAPGEPVMLSGADFCEELRSLLETAAPALQVDRMYENHLDYPGAAPLERLPAIDALDSGLYGLVHYYGHGSNDAWEMGDALFTSGDAAALVNGQDLFLLSAQTVEAAAFDGTCIIEEMLRNRDGGCVAGFGHSAITYVLTCEQYQESLVRALYEDGVRCLGQALWQVQQEQAAMTATSRIWHLAQQTLTLLGDPTLEAGPLTPTDVPGAPPVESTIVAIEDCVPNPFNPVTRIRFALTHPDEATVPVTVSVFDVLGRQVATLLTRDLSEGSHEVLWDSRDDQGLSVASGVYIAQVQVGGKVARAKLTLLK
jgi:hypothetical protein